VVARREGGRAQTNRIRSQARYGGLGSQSIVHVDNDHGLAGWYRSSSFLLLLLLLVLLVLLWFLCGLGLLSCPPSITFRIVVLLWTLILFPLEPALLLLLLAGGGRVLNTGWGGRHSVVGEQGKVYGGRAWDVNTFGGKADLFSAAGHRLQGPLPS
jgi:hypothetical protein